VGLVFVVWVVLSWTAAEDGLVVEVGALLELMRGMGRGVGQGQGCSFRPRKPRNAR
jgi:hypothetical protein